MSLSLSLSWAFSELEDAIREAIKHIKTFTDS
ncbi:unnamed protein product, partial [Rotaria sp. Silwood1]